MVKVVIDLILILCCIILMGDDFVDFSSFGVDDYIKFFFMFLDGSDFIGCDYIFCIF